MDSITLAEPQSRINFFQQSILANLYYWQSWLETRIDDVAALDRERNGLLKAILFALDLEAVAWSTACRFITTLSPYMEARGYWDIWSRVLNRAIQIADGLGDEAAVANLSALLARLLHRQSRYKESVAAYRRVIRLARRLGDQFGQARACTNLGYFYIEPGYWYRAEVLCCHALALFEQIDNTHGLAHTENHLGILYIRQGRWAEAQQRLERACTLWRARNDQHGLMRGYLNLGWLFNEMERPDEALLYLERALVLAEQAGDEATTGTIYLDMGIAFRLRGEFALAESYSHQAETILRRFSVLLGLAHVLENLGVIYLKQQKWLEAEHYLNEALSLWLIQGNKYSEIQSKIHLAEGELGRGDHTQAEARLHELQQLLEKYDRWGRYHQLHTQVNKLRCSLAG
jgi:tetratricopeptide (TPR) repeat protein